MRGVGRTWAEGMDSMRRSTLRQKFRELGQSRAGGGRKQVGMMVDSPEMFLCLELCVRMQMNALLPHHREQVLV